MVNPQLSGWRSEIRLCTCGLLELERSVLAICRPTSGDIRWRNTTEMSGFVPAEFCRKKVLRGGYRENKYPHGGCGYLGPVLRYDVRWLSGDLTPGGSP